MLSLLITGAASGIGAGLAIELARAGHHIIVSDLRLADCQAVAAKIREAGGSADALAMDVTSDASVAAAFASLPRPIDILVNDAGLQHVAPLEDFASLASVHSALVRESARIQAELDELWPESEISPSAHLTLLPAARIA